jgi:hypothetical protein
MKKTLLIAGLVIAIAGVASAELETVWMHTYGGTAADGFRQAIPTSDGGFVAAGYTYSFGSGDVDVFLVKTDSGGDTLWTRAYGGPSLDYGHSVCETGDGAYVVAGYTMSYGAGEEDVYLIKVDSAGDTLWTRTYGGAGLDEAKSVCFTSDGYIVVAGETESFGAGESDVYVLKVDTAGDTLWTRAFGGALADWAEAVCELADGSYGLSGTTGSFNTTRDAYALKVDPRGDLVWDFSYGSDVQYREDYGTGLFALADSGMVATGWRTDQDHFDPDQAAFLRLYATGLQQSYRKYTHPYIEYGTSICETADDGFVFCGAAKNDSTHRNDLFLVKRVQGAGWVWDQTVGGEGSDWGCSIAPLEPGFFLVAGYTESWGSGSFDGWLIRMRDEEAAVPPAQDGGSALHLAAPSPNPFRPMTVLRFNLPCAMQVELAVYDIGGRRVALLAEGLTAPGDHIVTWYGTDSGGVDVAPGVYLARLSAGESVVSRKIVRVK